MSARDELQKRFEQLQKRIERSRRLWQLKLDDLDALHKVAIKELDEEGQAKRDEINKRLDSIKSRIDAAGKEFSHLKYQLERETNKSNEEIEKAKNEIQSVIENSKREADRINQERIQMQVSHEKQRNALNDMYQEQSRHLLMNREKLLMQWTRTEEKLKKTRQRFDVETNDLREKGSTELDVLRQQLKSKQEGWSSAIETMRRNFEALSDEKTDLLKKLAEIKDEKAREIEQIRISMDLAKEQLEIDKATLIEKAEEDQRKTEAEVQSLREKVNKAERELQDLIVTIEDKKKNLEEANLREEQILKDTLKSESDKRDYEQKAYEQEKLIKEKEVNRLREEYERKKWHWENQIRSIMMKKTVLESEHDAEKMKVDRNARSQFRNLEISRDELKEKLAELKARHASIEKNAQKEEELVRQRWNWRKNRLWAMWQERLDVLRKEREAIHAQLEHLLESISKEKATYQDKEGQLAKQSGELEQFVLHSGAANASERRQKEIQIELEKARIITQIKECESLIIDWQDRVKMTGAEISQRQENYREDLGFLDTLIKNEEREIDLFLNSFRKALGALGVQLDSEGNRQEAA